MATDIIKKPVIIDEYNSYANRRTNDVSVGRGLYFSGSKYLSKAFSSAGNAQKATFSFWIKNVYTGVENSVYAVNIQPSSYFYISISSSTGNIRIVENNGGVTIDLIANSGLINNRIYNHIVVAIDTTQAVSTNRVRVYVNNVEIIYFSNTTYPSLNYNSPYLNAVFTHYLAWAGSANTPGGITSTISEFYKIDGQQLTPNAFGRYNKGNWVPRRYTGSYGVQGFYQNYSDDSNIGKDYSPNGNDFAQTGFTLPTDTMLGPYNQYNTKKNDIQPLYTIKNSIRLRDRNNAFLSKTNHTSGDRRRFTFAAWIKFNKPVGVDGFYTGGNQLFGGASDSTGLWITGSNFSTNDRLGGYWGGTPIGVTDFAIRDYTSWYHIMYAVDTTDATPANRIKIYVNGVLATWQGSPSYPSQNSDATDFGVSGNTLRIGTGNTSYNFGGNIADYYYIDGQQLRPDAFGYFDELGQWKPKRYEGNFGPLGSYLEFKDSSSLTNLGKDSSPNNRGWTLNNMSVTAGPTFDQMTDTPTNNYATMNFLGLHVANLSYNAFTDGALKLTTSGGGSSNNYFPLTIGTIGSGKYRIETTWSGTAVIGNAGVALWRSDAIPSGTSGDIDLYSGANGVIYFSNAFRKINGSSAAYGATWTSGDKIAMEWDIGTGIVQFFKNGTSQGTINLTLTPGEIYIPTIYCFTNADPRTPSFTLNCGQQPWDYTPTTGYVGLSTGNLPTVAIRKGSQGFNINLRSSNGTANLALTNAESFAPSLVWTKRRNSTTDHRWYDTTRGATKYISSNLTAAEATTSTGLTAFTGLTYRFNGSDAAENVSGGTHIDWLWKQGNEFGFQIISYAGDSTNNRTIAHTLGTAPQFIVIKNLTGGSNNWPVYHKSLTVGNMVFLSTTANQAAISSIANGGISAVSSTNFTLTQGSSNMDNVNTTGNNYIAYVWTGISGFSKFGSYTGNGSIDGPFVYLGFKPKFVMTKRLDGSLQSWSIIDSARSTFNPSDSHVWADLTQIESNPNGNAIDILANGFKVRSNAGINGNGSNYLYCAFAEVPFKYANSR